ncbi:hypothetical protein M0R45_027080 [Rubus argutus]|uniref:Uncharacterized protein n=1 Tax=Rubus argutus TaxID=59490 RepID=A0AAW1WZ90_RUBAR
MRLPYQPLHQLLEALDVAKHDSHVSDPVKHNANERKKHATVLNAKIIMVMVILLQLRNKSKLDCSITKSAVKASEKSKSLPLNQITVKKR